MIRAKWYKELMEYVDIPLSKTEIELLDKMTSKKGMVKEQVYMMRLLKQTAIPLTDNQITIMNMLAWIEGTAKAIKDKNIGRKRLDQVQCEESDS